MRSVFSNDPVNQIIVQMITKKNGRLTTEDIQDQTKDANIQLRLKALEKEGFIEQIDGMWHKPDGFNQKTEKPDFTFNSESTLRDDIEATDKIANCPIDEAGLEKYSLSNKYKILIVMKNKALTNKQMAELLSKAPANIDLYKRSLLEDNLVECIKGKKSGKAPKKCYQYAITPDGKRHLTMMFTEQFMEQSYKVLKKNISTS